ncbi:MAG: CoA-binding protein [Deltaproteobacteria bacterium]
MDDSIHEILTRTHTIAVVGLSNNPNRYSHIVAKYLKDHGYRIIPVNPKISEVLGERSYTDLASIPFPVDLVDVFRNTDAASDVVAQAVDLKIPVVWLQPGIYIPDVQELSANTGTICIDRCCIKAEHHRLLK